MTPEREAEIRNIVANLGGEAGKTTAEAGWQDDLAEVLAELDQERTARQQSEQMFMAAVYSAPEHTLLVTDKAQREQLELRRYSIIRLGLCFHATPVDPLQSEGKE